MGPWSLHGLLIWLVVGVLAGLIAGVFRRGLTVKPKLTLGILILAYLATVTAIMACFFTNHWTSETAPYLELVVVVLVTATVDRLVSGSITRR